MADREAEGGFQFRVPARLDALTASAFAAVSDDEIESATVQLVDELIAAHAEPMNGLQALPEFIRHWYVAFVVDAEILNGGFNQLFYNAAGAFAPVAPTALAEIGSPAAATIVSEALSLLAGHEPAIAAARESGTLEAFMESYIDQPFSELDERYVAIEEELRVARVEYLRAHAPRL